MTPRLQAERNLEVGPFTDSPVGISPHPRGATGAGAESQLGTPRISASRCDDAHVTQPLQGTQGSSSTLQLKFRLSELPCKPSSLSSHVPSTASRVPSALGGAIPIYSQCSIKLGQAGTTPLPSSFISLPCHWAVGGNTPIHPNLWPNLLKKRRGQE